MRERPYVVPDTDPEGIPTLADVMRSHAEEFLVDRYEAILDRVEAAARRGQQHVSIDHGDLPAAEPGEVGSAFAAVLAFRSLGFGARENDAGNAVLVFWAAPGTLVPDEPAHADEPD